MDRSRAVTTTLHGSRPIPAWVSTAAIVALPVAFLAYFFVYPLASILVTSLAGDAGAGSAFSEVLSRSALLSVVWFTTWQAALSTVLTLIVGLPAAYVFARYDFRGRRLLRAATTIPFVLPTVVVGTAFLVLLGPNGPLGVDLRRSIAAIIIAHVFYNYAIVARTVGSYWETLDPRLEDAAMTLGATRWQAFRQVTLPLLAPAIAAATSLVFLFTFTSFGVVLILGDLRHATIEVEIWRQSVALLNLPVAAVLAILQLVGIGFVLAWYSRTQERRSRQLRTRSVKLIKPRGRQRWLLWANLALMTILLAVPLALLVERSLRSGDGYSIDAYVGLAERSSTTGLFVPPLEAVGNSLRFALAATLIAVVVGTLAGATIAYRTGWMSRTFDSVLMLPLGTSAVTLGFGFLVALDSPVDLRTSPALIPIAHAVVAVPFVVRIVVPTLRRIRHRLREAAATLGAPPHRVWREIDLPLLSRSLLVAVGFAFAISLGEFGATSFIARPEAPTLPTAIFRLLGRPGDITFSSAMALSVVLMVLTVSAVLLIERFRIDRTGDV